MGTKHQSSSSDPITDQKKRRRVGFSKPDSGIEANDCIKVYLVSGEKEVDSPDSFCIEPVDLNQFFEEDGKIYGYQGLQITVWVSCISFHAYADISFQTKSDGGKGITDLQSALQSIFGENLVEKKDDFLKTFQNESGYVKSIISKGEILPQATDVYNKDSDPHSQTKSADVEVIRVVGMPVGHLYCRLVPLVLLLVDGSSPIDITDPKWEILLIVKKKNDQQEERLLGFAAVYRFFHYPDGLRLRMSQILVLPPFQHKGYGRCLLEVLNTIAINENVHDLTIEEPLDALQHVRTCIDVQRLLVFDPIQQALNAVVNRLKQENLSKKNQPCCFGPPPSAIEEVRKSLKMNKRQFLQCWEVLIYIALDPIDKYIENFTTIVSNRVRADVIGKDSGASGKKVIEVATDYDLEMSFVMFRSEEGEANSSKVEMDEENKAKVEEQLKQLVDERIHDIKAVAEKVVVVSP